MIYIHPKNDNFITNDCHIGFFWGNSSNENRFWHSDGGGNRISSIVNVGPGGWVMVIKTRDYSNISITKHSKIPELIETGNANYELAGAKYGVYTDAACTRRARDRFGNENGIITDTKGYGEARDLAVGTYWVKELSPSTNYQLDGIAHQVTTQANQTISAGASSEPFNYGGIEFQMRSSNTDMTNGNRCYSLAGGACTIYRDIACTKRVMDMTTDANGYATTKGQSGEHNIVFGTYWVKETKAPKGYVLDSRVVSVTFDKFDSNGIVKRISSSGDALIYAVPKLGLLALFREEQR